MASLKVACVVAVMCMVVVTAPVAQAAITCGQVATDVAPCVPYLKSGAGVPPGNCCTGVKNLNFAAKTTADRQAACNCLKSLAKSAGNLNANAAAGLPGKCGVNIPYKISTSTNCATIK